MTELDDFIVLLVVFDGATTVVAEGGGMVVSLSLSLSLSHYDCFLSSLLVVTHKRETEDQRRKEEMLTLKT